MWCELQLWSLWGVRGADRRAIVNWSGKKLSLDMNLEEWVGAVLGRLAKEEIWGDPQKLGCQRRRGVERCIYIYILSSIAQWLGMFWKISFGDFVIAWTQTLMVWPTTHPGYMGPPWCMWSAIDLNVIMWCMTSVCMCVCVHVCAHKFMWGVCVCVKKESMYQVALWDSLAI